MKKSVYKNYLLILLMMVLTFSYMDRVALSVVMQEIKIALHLSDTELGLLTGIAFTFFYASVGIPIARWADRGNRVTIISLSTALWSVMVALCGSATSFTQLVIFRIGCAAGEAGYWPAAHSLIPDYFTRIERPKAMGIFSMGISLSSLIGFAVTGWLNEAVGWRMMFVVIGLPGLLLAAITQATIREPRQSVSTFGVKQPLSASNTSQDKACAPSESQLGTHHIGHSDPSLKTTGIVLTLWKNVSCRHLFIQYSVQCLLGSGLIQWMPTFFIRCFGISTAKLGTMLALAFGLSGLIGTYAGGVVASRYLAHRERAQFAIIAVLCAFMGVMMSAVLMSSDAYTAITLLAICILGANTALGPQYAALQTMVPPHLRATTIALLFFVSHLIGAGLGPLIAGALSDALRPHFGVNSIRYALLILCPLYLWSAWHAWRVSKTVEGDIEAVSNNGDRPVAIA